MIRHVSAAFRFGCGADPQTNLFEEPQDADLKVRSTSRIGTLPIFPDGPRFS